MAPPLAFQAVASRWWLMMLPKLIDHLGLSTVHVVGQSGGGAHALAFAARHPERVGAASVVVGMVPLGEEDLGG